MYSSEFTLTTNARESRSIAVEQSIAEAVVAAVQASAGTTLRGDVEDAESVSLTFFDSFDWRFHRAGMCLARVEEPGRRTATLHQLNSVTGEVEAQLTLPSARAKSRLDISTLPASPMQQWLSKRLGVRVALPLIEIVEWRRTINLRDEEGKTVVRLRATTATVTDVSASDSSDESRRTELLQRVRIVSLRGYEDEAHEVETILRGSSDWRECEVSRFEEALGEIGRSPGDYQSAFFLPLSPEMEARTALRAILNHLLISLERNEPGLRADLDPEFLHDYRVAIRRTRTLLGQMRTVLPDWGRFEEMFRTLGQVTGPTRDLDVSLLDYGALQETIPPEMRGALHPLATRWQRRRRAARKALLAYLDGDAYLNALQDWRDALATTGSVGADNAWPVVSAQPIGDIASARIHKTWKRIMREGKAITPETEPAALHDLRKSCKKLRYLLEFFQSLFPPADIKSLIKSLKQLQDNLGTFQDCEVQALSMMEIANGKSGGAKTDPATFMSVGAAVSALFARQHAARDAFAETFKGFATHENKALVTELFGR
ncbi:MAG: CHAD domain-containing protein [Pseudomonadota bacterium]